MIVNTIAQYKCLQWIMDHFNQDVLNIEIVDDITLKITDKFNEQAFIHWDFQEGITVTLREIDNQYVLGRLPNKYIVYRKEQENEVVEANGYVAITHIQEFTSEEDAYEQLRIITEAENFEDSEEDEE